MTDKAGIQDKRNFTNTLGRKTTIQSLRGNFDPLAILQLAGHANPSSTATIQWRPRKKCLANLYNNTAATVNASSSNHLFVSSKLKKGFP